MGQWVANDLRMRTYHHLQYLSLRYYDSHQTGSLLSTITADVLTIQNFASSATLGIVVDMFTILGMLVVMFFLNWDFTLIAVAITPLLLLLASRFKKAVKKSTHEVRMQQSNIVSVVQQDLESIRVVKAFGRQELEQQALEAVSHATVAAALKARQVKALLSPIVSIIVSFCIAFVLWRGSLLILSGSMTAGELTVFLSYLASFFKPVKDLASMNNSIAQTAVAVERVRTILDADSILPEKADAGAQPIHGAIAFDHVAFAYDEKCPVLSDVTFTVEPGQTIGVVGPTGGGKSTIMSLIPRFLRSLRRRSPGGWNRCARLPAAVLTRPDRLRAAGNGALPRNNPRQYRLRPRRRNRRGDCRSGEVGQCRRIHRPHARWL